jgi:hypothetical protein
VEVSNQMPRHAPLHTHNSREWSRIKLEKLDAALVEILARARPISERDNSAALPKVPSLVPLPTIERRLSRWSQVVAYGDEEGFRQRL